MSGHLTGVYTAKKKDGTIYYRASITFRTRHISLGSFPHASHAHLAYVEADRILNDTSVTLNSCPAPKSLSFAKMITLFNFRDNNIYFSNPIYLHIKYFEYYLSPSSVLKFDLDDLFYYSSHKIMQRGNRLFVAEYGMQTGIASRYGIKNYGVKDRDFCFINGDPLDFRYANIRILNRYHGVSLAVRQGTVMYRAKIHIRGDYCIGYYEDEITAAIAYNKAIDLLKKAGITKRYVPNYIENLSPALYADLYDSIVISDKIKNYSP